jgi:nitrogen regulatory protein PII
MNFVISIVNPGVEEIMKGLYSELSLPVAAVFHGEGTAVQSMLDLLGIESVDKLIFVTVAPKEKTERLFELHRNRLYTGVPGHGIAVSIPVKSVGGGKILAYLNDNKPIDKEKPELNTPTELIIVIGNEGCTDTVMNAARSAGATGGTVIHGKGTGDKKSEKFYNVSIAKEKEVILIVTPTARKADIMRAVLEKAGPETKSGGIVFSLPVSEAIGFGAISN